MSASHLVQILLPEETGSGEPISQEWFEGLLERTDARVRWREVDAHIYAQRFGEHHPVRARKEPRTPNEPAGQHHATGEKKRVEGREERSF